MASSPQRSQLVLVFYGKGGVGKSTVATHVAEALAAAGRRVLLCGCDPKADSALRILGDSAPATVVGLLEEGRAARLADVLSRGDHGVDVVEAGGSEPGTGCAGHGVKLAVRLLEQERAAVARYDAIVFDVLGDLVCGGFAAPLRFGAGSSVVAVSSEEHASLFALNNIVRLIGRDDHEPPRSAGVVYNLREEAPLPLLEEFAGRLELDVVGVLERDPAIRAAEAAGATVLRTAPEGASARRFREIAARIEALDHAARPRRPRSLPLPELRDRLRRLRAARVAVP